MKEEGEIQLNSCEELEGLIATVEILVHTSLPTHSNTQLTALPLDALCDLNTLIRDLAIINKHTVKAEHLIQTLSILLCL